MMSDEEQQPSESVEETHPGAAEGTESGEIVHPGTFDDEEKKEDKKAKKKAEKEAKKKEGEEKEGEEKEGEKKKKKVKFSKRLKNGIILLPKLPRIAFGKVYPRLKAGGSKIKTKLRINKKNTRLGLEILLVGTLLGIFLMMVLPKPINYVTVGELLTEPENFDHITILIKGNLIWWNENGGGPAISDAGGSVWLYYDGDLLDYVGDYVRVQGVFQRFPRENLQPPIENVPFIRVWTIENIERPILA